ncbi:MAG: hypothetical protein ACFHWX_01240 [Bacteroidota bacterium]
MKFLRLLLIVPLLWACQPEDIPVGFYDYQVVRLLASDSAKTWFRTQYIVDGNVISISSCEDSVYSTFRLHERYPKDSVYAFEVIPQTGCAMSDTLLLGGFAASSTDNVFTDSLNFKEGPVDFMLVESITSKYLKLVYQRAGKNVSASFEAVQ